MHHSIRQAYIVKFGIIVTAYALFFYFLKAQQAVIARGLAGISRKAVRRFPQVDSNNRKTLVLCHLIDLPLDRSVWRYFQPSGFHTTDRETRFVPKNIRRQDPHG